MEHSQQFNCEKVYSFCNFRFSVESKITDLVWKPNENTISFANIDGEIVHCEDVVGHDSKSSLEAVVISFSTPSAKSFISSAAEVKKSVQEKKSLASRLDELTNFDDEDEQLVDEKLEDYQYSKEDDFEALIDKVKVQEEEEDFPVERFQPAATDFHNGRRLLAWNMTAYAIQREGHSSQLNIDIEFHDRTKFRSIHFTDHYSFTMGALSDRGAAFASQIKAAADKKDQEPSVIHYVPFESWAANSDWTISLPKDENAFGIACGSSTVAVATSENNLRFFSFSGYEKHVVSFCGDFVSMAANGNTLLVVFAVKNQLKSFTCRMDTFASEPSIEMPLKNDSVLIWIGLFNSVKLFVILVACHV